MNGLIINHCGRNSRLSRSFTIGVELKERGEQWQGFCPLPTHEGKRQSPSFSANVGRGIWQCFGCGAKGNLIEFAARMEGLNPDNPDDFRKAALLLQKTFRRRGARETGIRAKGSNTGTKRAGGPRGGCLCRRERAARLRTPTAGVRSPVPAGERVHGRDNQDVRSGVLSPGTLGYAGRIVDEEAIGKDTLRYLFPGSRERNGTRHEFRKSARVSREVSL
jgi:hypothetical protein